MWWQAYSHRLFEVNPATDITFGIVAAPQLSADLTSVPWLSYDPIRNVYEARLVALAPS
jgi:hypothetical protein